MVLESILNLLLALVLGGVVGYERENNDRPAGFRTHILVSVGSALAQIISINYFRKNGIVGMDPMRIGAQVISGIGFLGAGTIIKEGANIKGLTTAASLWTVACIGLAAGSGLYGEAAAATAFIYAALKILKRFEDLIIKRRKYLEISIITENVPGKLGQIGVALGSLNILIEKVNIETLDEKTINIVLLVKKNCEVSNEAIGEKLMLIENIKDIKL